MSCHRIHDLAAAGFQHHAGQSKRRAPFWLQRELLARHGQILTPVRAQELPADHFAKFHLCVEIRQVHLVLEDGLIPLGKLLSVLRADQFHICQAKRLKIRERGFRELIGGFIKLGDQQIGSQRSNPGA